MSKMRETLIETPAGTVLFQDFRPHRKKPFPGYHFGEGTGRRLYSQCGLIHAPEFFGGGKYVDELLSRCRDFNQRI